MNPQWTFLLGLLYWTGAIPWLQAWRAQRQTSLIHAIRWAMLAWIAWGMVATAPLLTTAPAGRPWRYLALCLTGCAAVAVLGARRPGVGPWNFVVLGLLAVLLTFWAEGLLAGSDVRLGELRLLFLVATVGVGVANYLPTRLGPAALLVGMASGLEITAWIVPNALPQLLPELLLALTPWTAWAALRWRQAAAQQVDVLWRAFRDTYGLVWGLRVREQFENAVRHAGLPVELTWSGLRAVSPAALSPDVLHSSAATLQALLRRFGPEAPDVSESSVHTPRV